MSRKFQFSRLQVRVIIGSTAASQEAPSTKVIIAALSYECEICIYDSGSSLLPSGGCVGGGGGTWLNRLFVSSFDFDALLLVASSISINWPTSNCSDKARIASLVATGGGWHGGGGGGGCIIDETA